MAVSESPSLETLGYPIGYKAVSIENWPSIPLGDVAMRTEARALTGMQKEALVYYQPTRTLWRFASDEGPYLKGTDLAPFPLAFYAAGMAFSFAAEFLKHARAYPVTIEKFELEQDNFYTMEGSAIRGDMLGGCLPTKILLKADTDADDATLQTLTAAAEKSSPAQGYMRSQLQNVFSLWHNGVQVEVVRLHPSQNAASDPATRFNAPPAADNPRDDMVIKLDAAEAVFGVTGGAGSSLQSEQKRLLHVRTLLSQREDGLLEAKVQLLKPIGSTFRFLCDVDNTASGDAQAPPPLAYLAAGVAFCFMTQVGRYAKIVKRGLQSYRVVQDTVFNVAAGQANAEPVDTHLFIETAEASDVSQKLLSMSEQTCFLHAAMRTEVPSEVSVERL